IFSGEKYITVPGKSMPGLFMGINMGEEYLNVGAGPLQEAYIGPMPPAVYADWTVSVPVLGDIQENQSKEPDSQKERMNRRPEKDLIILSSQNSVYQYKEGLSAKFENNIFTAKVPGEFGYAFSGIEIDRADRMKLKVNADTPDSVSDNSFCGFVLDYHTKMGYQKRVWLGFMGSLERYDRRVCPWIYDDSSMSLVQRVAFSEEFININKEIKDNIIELSFADYAPSDWDGRLWLACGLQNCEKETEITAEILDKKIYAPNSSILKTEDIKGRFIKFEKGDITLAVSKNNGAVCGLWHNDEKVLDECADRYTLCRKESTLTISETFDKVRKTEKKNNSLILTCENMVAPELIIIKEYSFSDTGEMKKKVSFDTEDSEGFFIRLDNSVQINDKFRKEATGYGALASRKVVAQGKVVEQTDEVASEQAGNGVAPVIIKKDLSFGFGTFRYKVNDRYVMRSFSQKTQKGFYSKIFTDYLRPKNPVSGETVYKFFSGNLSVFDKYYMNLPEYKELFSFESPEWIKRVVADGMYLTNEQEEFLRFADPLIVTETIWFYNSPWGNWGGYHENPDGMFPGTHDVAPGYRSSFPNTRIAKYNNFTFDTGSDTYRDHKDWGVRDREGELVSTGIASDCNQGPSFYPQILNPEVKKGLLNMHKEQMKQWKFDYFYTDGPGYGQEEIDWGIMDVTQNYDWLEYLRDLYKTLREVNPEAVIFSNGLMPYSSFSYIEYRDPQWQQLMTDEWRQIATELYQAKYEEPAGNTKVPTYGNRTADPALSSYMIMYGWVGHLTDKSRYPFMEAAWEYRGLSLLEDAVSPNWLNEDVYFEATAFDKKGNTVVNILNHDSSKDKVKFTLDVSKTNLKIGEPVNIYYMCMKDTPKVNDETGETDSDSVGKSAFGEPVILSWGEICKDKTEIEVPAVKGLVTSVVLTHSPAVVKSVNNRNTQTYLPNQLDAECLDYVYEKDEKGISGSPKSLSVSETFRGENIKSVSFDVSARQNCEIIVPCFGNSSEIWTSYPWEECRWGNKKSIRIKVPVGEHSFKINVL
ncbi:MAG: hypothetical protein KBT47_01365, partial [Armatimonadetes bacterium]|nr:hypothetical protein [Candidatus Hippobium faecium]